MKMAEPDRIEIWPVKLFLSHAMGSVCADIEENVTGTSLEPVCARGAAGVWQRSAGSQNDEPHEPNVAQTRDGVSGSEPTRAPFALRQECNAYNYQIFPGFEDFDDYQ